MAPIVYGLRLKWEPEVQFVFLDVSDQRSESLKTALDYCGVPQSVLLDGEGVVLKQWVGEVGEEDLDSAIQSAMP